MSKLLKKIISVLVAFSLITAAFVSCDSDDGDDDSGGGSSSGSYHLTMKINGTETVFDGGLTSAGSKPIASLDSTDNTTSIFAFAPSVDAQSMQSGNGFMFTNIHGTTAGVYTCNVVYYTNGTMNAAQGCTITIDSYGARGEAVTGSLANTTVNGYVITDCTFSVYNYGTE